MRKFAAARADLRRAKATAWAGRTRENASAADPSLANSRPPPPGQGKRGESGYLGYLLRQAQAAARLRMERALADLGVTPPQFLILTMLKAYPGLSGAELARVALLTPQTVGVIIRNLQRAGSIGKAAHPVHCRVLMWSLTPKGLALLGLCRQRAAAVERRLAKGLTAETEIAVRRWLAQVAMELNKG
jgi:DNA-binding MarR family transcriptional regulator